MKKSRGLRNNNPGNIEKNNTKWQGLANAQNDSRFCTFISMPYGYRAMFRTIRTYVTKHNRKTITDIINRWAPPVENATDNYIKVVSNRAKIRPNVEIDVNNKFVMCRLVEAMSFVENGVAGVMSEIEEGWNLI